MDSDDEEQEEYPDRTKNLVKRDAKQARRDEGAFYRDQTACSDSASDDDSDEGSDKDSVDDLSGPDAEGTLSEPSSSLDLDKVREEPSTKIRHLLGILARESSKHKVIMFS